MRLELKIAILLTNSFVILNERRIDSSIVRDMSRRVSDAKTNLATAYRSRTANLGRSLGTRTVYGPRSPRLTSEPRHRVFHDPQDDAGDASEGRVET